MVRGQQVHYFNEKLEVLAGVVARVDRYGFVHFQRDDPQDAVPPAPQPLSRVYESTRGAAAGALAAAHARGEVLAIEIRRLRRQLSGTSPRRFFRRLP